MRKSVCRILWTLPVLTMLLINNPILSAQLLEETTAFTESDQNSVVTQQQNDDSQSQTSITELYLYLNNLLPLDLVNSESNGSDNIYLNNNGTTIWGPVEASGSNFYDIDTIIPVSSTSSVRLELFDKNSGRSLGKVSFSFNTLNKIIDKGERYYTFSHKWYSSATWKYKLNYEVKSTNSSSDFSARAQAASIPKLYSPSSAYSINNLSLKFGDPWPYTSTSCTNLNWKHTGIDIKASAGSDVYAAEAGTVKVSKSTSGSWKDYITIEHKDSQGNKYTTVYWHLYDRKVSVSNSVTRGQKIAAVANMGSNTHLHFGIRNAPYTYPVSSRGGLPTKRCYDPEMTAMDIWQANFVNPSDYLP